jgi:hypothetical protein
MVVHTETGLAICDKYAVHGVQTVAVEAALGMDISRLINAILTATDDTGSTATVWSM